MEEYVAAVDEVSRGWAFGVKMQGRKRSGAVQRHEDLSGTLKTGSMDVNRALYSRVQSCRRRKHSDPFWDDTCDRIGRIYYPGVKRPQEQDARGQARYDARALLAAMDSTHNLARQPSCAPSTIASLAPSNGQQYVRVYDKIMCTVAEKNRFKQKSTLSKLKAAIMLNGITGSVKAFMAFRRLERQMEELSRQTAH
jgi:hypothetical protein